MTRQGWLSSPIPETRTKKKRLMLASITARRLLSRYGAALGDVWARRKAAPADCMTRNVQVNDPGPTYRAGANRYNISLKSKSIEDIYTDNTSMKFVGKGPGKGVYLPLELYCRKRPKIEVQIFDLETERDVGSRESVYFQVCCLNPQGLVRGSRRGLPSGILTVCCPSSATDRQGREDVPRGW